MPADVILNNAKIATNGVPSIVEAIAIKDGKIEAVGTDDEILRHRGPVTKVIDAKGRTVIPGLNDSHMHPIRGGLNYNLELRWDGVPSLAEALRMLKEQAARTPPPQWVRVIGGWTEFQFAEHRMPTLEEINAAAPETPLFVLHLYDRAWLNGAALRAVGYTKDTPAPPGGEIQRDKQGNPTGLLIARPNAMILYATLAKGPKLSHQDQMNSTRQFIRELNRFGITSVIDAGGGFQNYPDDYEVVNELHRRGELTVRFASNLFTQKPKQELADFQRWTQMTKPGEGDDFYRVNGAGEMLVFSAADFEDFLEPRPEMPPVMEDELKMVIRHLVENRWPFRLHATYDETISRALKVYEEVNREVPFAGLHWFFDHCETISDRNIERVRALGGGIAVQDRMAFQGEYFVNRYGAKQAQRTPPIRRMLELGVPVGAGTDATRVSSYNPFVALYWLITGKTVGGTALYPEVNRLDRMEALRLYTVGSSWFSAEEGKKGSLMPGQFADLSVLSADYFSIPAEQIKHLESVLTVVGGRVVFAAGEFEPLGPPPLPVSPDWSPVKPYGGYFAPGCGAFTRTASAMRPRSPPGGKSAPVGAQRVRAVVPGLRLLCFLALKRPHGEQAPASPAKEELHMDNPAGTARDFTEKVLDAYSNIENPRLKFIVAVLIKHLHACVREMKVTDEEWEFAWDFMRRMAAITGLERNEFLLFGDVIGVSQLIETLNHEELGQPVGYALVGPFLRANAPWRARGASIASDGTAGVRVRISGRVFDFGNKTPIKGAILDTWQAATNGFYENQDEKQPDYNLRGRFKTDENGTFEVMALMPTAYPAPTDGPVGELLRAAKRSPYRPAHIHFIVSAPGYETLVTQIFVKGDKRIEKDVVFTASENMVGDFQKEGDHFRLSYDFPLKPGISKMPKAPIPA